MCSLRGAAVGVARASPAARAQQRLERLQQKLPSLALQSPREATFQELELVHFLCHLVQSQLTSPQPPRHTPAPTLCTFACI